MTHPGETFDPSFLDTVHSATQQAFEELTKTQEALASRDHMRGVEVGFVLDDTTTVNIHCYESNSRNPQTNQSSHIPTLWAVYNQGENGANLSVRSAEKPNQDTINITTHITNLLAQDLPPEEAAWLQSITAAVAHPDTELAAYTVDNLLDTSPFELYTSTSFFLRRNYQNGSTFVGNWTEGNDTFVSGLPQGFEYANFTLIDPNGVEYAYSRHKDQPNKLYVHNPANEVPREVSATPIKTEGHGVNLEILGTPEFVRTVNQAVAARREAAELGMDTPVEGTMRAFVKEWRAAIASGIADQQ